MAYVLEDEEEKQGQQQGPAQIAPMAAPAAGGAPSPMAQPKPQGPSTGHVSWDQIYNANKDAAKTQANKLADNLGAGAKAAQGKIAGAQKSFGQAVAAGTPQFGATQAGAGTNPFGQQAMPQGQKGPTGAVKTGDMGRAPPQQAAPIFTTETQAPKPGGDMTVGQNAVNTGPTPMRVAEDGAPGTVTQQEAQRQAGLTYTGPDSLADSADWASILGETKDAARKVGLAGQRDALGNLQGDSGIEALLGPGNNRFDAALLGAAGRKRFGDTQREYAGLMKGAEDAEADSRKQSAAARETVATGVKDAQDALARYERELKVKQSKADAEAQAKADARDDFSFDAGGKKQNYYEYNNTNQFENTLRSFGQALDPVDHIIRAAGDQGSVMRATRAMDKNLNQNAGTSLHGTKFNWGWSGGVAGFSDGVKSAVYESLSQDELDALEQMGAQASSNFVVERARQLKQRAQTLWQEKVAPIFKPGMTANDIFNALKGDYDVTPVQIYQLMELVGFKG